MDFSFEDMMGGREPFQRWARRQLGLKQATLDANHEAEAFGSFYGGIETDEDGASVDNAYRHMLISALMARKYGQGAAELLGRYHEGDPFSAADFVGYAARHPELPLEFRRKYSNYPDTVADEQNNHAGAAIGAHAKTDEDAKKGARERLVAALLKRKGWDHSTPLYPISADEPTFDLPGDFRWDRFTEENLNNDTAMKLWNVRRRISKRHAGPSDNPYDANR